MLTQLQCIFIQKWAVELDASTDTKKPLHGLPFSVKDNVSVGTLCHLADRILKSSMILKYSCFFLVGYDCTAGISKFIDQSAVEDAALVSALRGLGAIPFCRTNVPQTLLRYSCLCSFACS